VKGYELVEAVARECVLKAGRHIHANLVAHDRWLRQLRIRAHMNFGSTAGSLAGEPVAARASPRSPRTSSWEQRLLPPG
jgi:hypothetical protein